MIIYSIKFGRIENKGEMRHTQFYYFLLTVFQDNFLKECVVLWNMLTIILIASVVVMGIDMLTYERPRKGS